MTHTYRLWQKFSRLVMAACLLAVVAACGGGGDSIAPPGSPPADTNLPLTLEVVGTGNVTSQPDGLNCSTGICSARFAPDTVVTLTASPGAGQSFAGWSGACTGAASTCLVTMDPVRVAAIPDVTARFIANTGASTFTFSLTIAGAGTVVSTPAGISCTSDCSAVFPANTPVTLTATPAAGQSFAFWSGACTGAASSCTVTVDQARTVGATFQAIAGTSFALNVAVSGSGSVASSPAGISCGSACSANFASGTAVTLTATPAAGQRFTGWGGACSGGQASCSLLLTQVRAVQAAFAAAPASSGFQTAQLLETSDDFNVGRNTLLAVNSRGDAIVLFEQSDGVPNGSTLKVFSRRYQTASGWQTPVVVPGAISSNGNDVSGKLFLDNAGVATWIRSDLQTRRNTASNGWSAAFNPPNLRFSQVLTSAVMDASGNIGVLRSGSDVENNALAVGGQWGAWARVDNGGSSVADRAKVALSSDGTALAVWRQSNPGDSNYSMKAARYTPTGGWGVPENIETLFTNVTSASPAVVIDAQGNGIAMWQQGNNNTVYYNVYRSGSGWQGAVEVTGQTNALGSASIELVMTPDGRAVAAWSGGGSLAGLNTMQYSHVTGWTTPVIVDTYNINRTLQMDNSGQAVMIYSPTIVGTGSINFDLVSRRLTFGGQWSAPTVVETAPGDVIDTAQFVINPAGQGVATWIQNDSPTTGARKSLWSALLQ